MIIPIILTFVVWILTFLLIVKCSVALTQKYLIFALLLYLIPVFYLPPLGDVALWETVGVKSLEGIDFYSFDRPTHGTFPFLPFMIWPHTLFHLISKTTGLQFVIFIRLLTIISVFGIVVLINKFIENKEKARKAQALFLFNPMVLLVTALHGQIDMIVAFFVLLSVYLLQIKKNRIFFSGISFGLSILVKTWSIIFFPIIFFRLKKSVNWTIGIMGVISVFVLLYMIVFFANPKFILDASIRAGGGVGFWGYTLILNKLYPIFPFTSNLYFFFDRYGKVALLILFIMSYLLIMKRELSIIKSLVLLVLVFLIFTSNWGLQYSSWVLPFAAAAGLLKRFTNYSLIALAYTSISYFSIINPMPIRILEWTPLLGIPLWIYTIFWLFDFLKLR